MISGEVARRRRERRSRGVGVDVLIAVIRATVEGI